MESNKATQKAFMERLDAIESRLDNLQHGNVPIGLIVNSKQAFSAEQFVAGDKDNPGNLKAQKMTPEIMEQINRGEVLQLGMFRFIYCDESIKDLVTKKVNEIWSKHRMDNGNHRSWKGYMKCNNEIVRFLKKKSIGVVTKP